MFKDQKNIVKKILPKLTIGTFVLLIIFFVLSLVTEIYPLFTGYLREEKMGVSDLSLSDILSFYLMFAVTVVPTIVAFFIVIKKQTFNEIKIAPEDINLLKKMDDLAYLHMKADGQYDDTYRNLRLLRVLCPHCFDVLSAIPNEKVTCESCASIITIPSNTDSLKRNESGVLIAKSVSTDNFTGV